MTKVLVLHSAGIDSSAVLHHLLVQQIDVLAVHLTMPDPWPMFPPVEQYWVQRQWDWLTEQGFTFDTAIIGNPEVVEGTPFSVTLLNAAATLFVADPTLTHVISGRCAEDAMFSTRDWNEGWALFASLTGKTRDQVRMISPFRDQTKDQAASTLPTEFMRLLWGCRLPRILPPDDPTDLENASQCEMCHTCLHYAAAGIRETVYWIEPPPVPDGPFPIPGVDWDAKRPPSDSV